MSTITATPAPSISRTPLLVGLGVLGAAVVVAVAVPAISSLTDSAPSTTVVVPRSYPLSGGPDVAERQGVAERMRAEARLDRLAKAQGNPAAVSIPLLVPTSVVAAQVSGLQGHYEFTGRTGALGSAASQQIGGMHEGYPWSADAYTRWNDSYVPPFRDPAWADAIQKHYYGTRASS